DEGQLSDAHGKHADFRNAVIILTSNLVLHQPQPPTALGFNVQAARPLAILDPREELVRYFRPELVNRIDEILLFQPLDKASLRRIIDRYIKSLESLAARNIRIELTDEFYDFLIDRGVSERFGARELRRAIDRFVRQPLAEELIRRSETSGVVRAALARGEVQFEFASSVGS